MRSGLWLVLLLGCARAERPPEPASCCVSSASAKPVTPVMASDSAESCWTRLLVAMRAGDDATIAILTTANGRASLEKGVSGEDKHVAYARWGKGWAAWEIRWTKRSDDRAEASLGPEVKEHGLIFVRESGAWKLDRWTPGE